MTFDGIILTWHWSPFSLAALLLLCLGYGLTLWLMHRQKPAERPIKKRQIAWFCSSVLIIALFLFTPIDTVARTQLFLAHMFQVVFIITFAVPFMLFSFPDWLFEPVFHWPPSRMVMKALTQPVVASVTFNATFLLWHLPSIYDKTLQYSYLYHTMLWSLFLVSFLNWWPLIGRERQLHQLSHPAQIAFAFLDGEPLQIYAFIIVFSGVVIYPYAVPPQFLSAYADQAAAGALLLLPGIVDWVVMSPLFFRWLGDLEAKARRNDERLQALREARERAEMEEEEEEGIVFSEG
ncbi:MAG TPA: cytochrome c oxidase assembly protein [Ktedonobacteraceae bacterium]|nr:cytochrome c oxidase assembly protein [Ktedonobacteraceae bacterium]